MNNLSFPLASSELKDITWNVSYIPPRPLFLKKQQAPPPLPHTQHHQMSPMGAQTLQPPPLMAKEISPRKSHFVADFSAFTFTPRKEIKMCIKEKK